MKKFITSIVAFVFTCLFIFTWISIPDNKAVTTSHCEQVPMLVSIKQIACDTIQITYDQPCDIKKATKIANYWMQDTQNINPTGIASLGQDEKLTANNALSYDQAIVTAIDNSNTVFNIKFNDKIPTGAKYRLIICSITAPNGPDYTGDNGRLVFTGL